MKKAAIVILSILAYGCVRLMRGRAKRPTPQAAHSTKTKKKTKPQQEPEPQPIEPLENNDIIPIKNESLCNSPIPTNTIRCVGDECTSRALSLTSSMGKFIVEEGYRFWDISFDEETEELYITFSKDVVEGFTSISIVKKKTRRKDQEWRCEHVYLRNNNKLSKLQHSLHMEEWSGQYLTIIDSFNYKEEGIRQVRLTYIPSPPADKSLYANNKTPCPQTSSYCRTSIIPKGTLRITLQKTPGSMRHYINFSKRVGMLLRDKGYIYWGIGMRRERTGKGSYVFPYIILAKHWDNELADVYIYSNEKSGGFQYKITHKSAILIIEKITQTKLKDGQLLQISDYHISKDKLYLRVQPCKDIETKTT